MISIILTTHVEDYARFVHLRYSFKQLLQTIGHYEIIVIDNSAQTGYQQNNRFVSPLFFKQFWSRIRYYPQSENTGMGKAKNIGVAHAQGDFLMFVDNDFFYEDPGWLMQCRLLHKKGTILSPLPIREYYWVKEEPQLIRVSKFSPGGFFIDRETYGDYQWSERHPIPGRDLRVAFKDTPQYILRTPKVFHEGYDIRSPHR